MVVNF